MSEDRIRLKVTGDGSHTLFIPEMNENYHSWHGAYTESMYIFIRQGFEQLAVNGTIRILEPGFGTGLNAILTLRHALGNGIPVTYTGIEKFPLPETIISALNYNTFLQDDRLYELFLQMHALPWNEPATLSEDFSFLKIDGSIHDYKPETSFHLIYFDAFAPEKQPDMWTQELMQSLYDLLEPGGILVTYCAKGSFKRSLKAAGFEVETLPGPPGKREMVRARKQHPGKFL